MFFKVSMRTQWQNIFFLLYIFDLVLIKKQLNLINFISFSLFRIFFVKLTLENISKLSLVDLKINFEYRNEI